MKMKKGGKNRCIRMEWKRDDGEEGNGRIKRDRRN